MPAGSQEAPQDSLQPVIGCATSSADQLTASEHTNGSNSRLHRPLDFRILTEPIALRPNKSVYGVPFDLADTSQGSAVSEMIQQLREADTALAAMQVMDSHAKAEE